MIVVWNGLSFEVHPFNSSWANVPGIYIFSGFEGKAWKAIYIGTTTSFVESLPDHERWDEAVDHGATRVHVMVVPSRAERERIADELIQSHHPPMNEGFK
jgi:hypothetical protein